MKLAAMIKKMCPSEAELSIPAKNCYRMVILGSSKVGKTAIVSRFLTGRFEEQYTPTIEDFHRKFYSIRGEVYQLDILDTSGNHPFPAMRRLSILTGTCWGGSLARFQVFLPSLGMFLQFWEEGGGILPVHGVGNFAPWTEGYGTQVLPAPSLPKSLDGLGSRSLCVPVPATISRFLFVPRRRVHPRVQPGQPGLL